MRIDTHVHFWHYSPTEHTWMTDAMDSLRRSFLPADLQPLLAAVGFDGAVAVQARQLIRETEWLLELADQHALIKGVVGWVDLQSPEVTEQLERFSGHWTFKSGRHARQFARKMPCGMIGINVGVPAPMALLPFAGWGALFLGDLHMQGTEGVQFYTRQRVVLSRWDSGYRRQQGW